MEKRPALAAFSVYFVVWSYMVSSALVAASALADMGKLDQALYASSGRTQQSLTLQEPGSIVA